MRYLEVSAYHLRPGHSRGWTELVKMVRAADEKAVPDSHWAMFQGAYGGEGGTFIILEARKTLAELDRLAQEQTQFEAAMGEEGMVKLSELFGEVVQSSSHQLFAFNPRMSYVSEEWIKADPDFWKPKKVTAPPAKPAMEEKKATP